MGLPDHTSGLNWPKTPKITPKIAYSYITKLFPDHTNGLNRPKTPKITPKIARSALSGVSTAVTLVTNHSIFIKRPYVKLLELKTGVPTPQSGSPTTKMTLIGQNTPSHKHRQNSMIGSVMGSDSCDIGNQALWFH